MIIAGIVGNEGAKFTPEREAYARELIRRILTQPGVVAMTSGGCHLGGIDIWAEEEAAKLGLHQYIFLPKELSWSNGYKPRNLKIARQCTELHNIVVASYPPNYSGMHFSTCYHCQSNDHVKSGGCWTRVKAAALGRKTHQWIVP